MIDFLLALATWRISSILVNESAPYDLAAKLRHIAGVRYNRASEAYAETELGKLFTCVFCMSVHIGVIIAFLHYRNLKDVIVKGLAYSAGSIIIETYVHR